MIPFFQHLGESIERAWLRHGYDEEVFPPLVLDALAGAPPAGQVTVEELIDWIASPVPGVPQPDGTALFGEPPLLLFRAPRFYIEALFWLSSTTAIHQHAFCGAFSVLAGASVHSHWTFAPERTVNSRLLCGRLTRASTEILRRGDSRPIHAGSRLIHQLFHLELPSVTVVIRTETDRRHKPQWDYLPPGLALDPEGGDGLRTRRLVLLAGMAQGRIAGLRAYVHRLIDNGDLETLFFALQSLARRRVDPALLAELHAAARERHGNIVDLFREVNEWDRRSRAVTALRAKTADPRSRFLLALLMLMPDRDAILEAVRLQFPEEEPPAAIEACVQGLAGSRALGFELDDEGRLIFRGLLAGAGREELVQRLRAAWKDDSFPAHRDRLLAQAARMAGSELLRPLFPPSTSQPV